MSSSSVSPPATKYIRDDLLLPGDVFLSRGTNWESNLIAWSTFGPFSHAAIHVGNGCLFESRAKGVGYCDLKMVMMCRNPGHGSFILLDVSHLGNLRILRHPTLSNLCSNITGIRKTQDGLIRTLGSMVGLEYPSSTALATAVPYIPRIVTAPILWAIDRLQRSPKVVVPGMFCSQLVVRALRKRCADPLMKTYCGKQVAAEKISPNRLQSRKTLLVPVQDIIVDDTFPCQQDSSHEYFLAERQKIQRQWMGSANTELQKGIRQGLSKAEKRLAQAIKDSNRRNRKS